MIMHKFLTFARLNNSVVLLVRQVLGLGMTNINLFTLPQIYPSVKGMSN